MLPFLLSRAPIPESNRAVCARLRPGRAAARAVSPSRPTNFMTCRFRETRSADGAIGAFHGIIRRTSLDVGSPKPRADQDCRRTSPAHRQPRTRATTSAPAGGAAESGGGAAEGGGGAAEGGARILFQENPGVGARQPRTHRGGHQILLMGAEAGARTRQDRS